MSEDHRVATILDAAVEILKNRETPFMVRFAALECLYAFMTQAQFSQTIIEVVRRVGEEPAPECVANSSPKPAWGYYRGLWDDMIRDMLQSQTT